jgi:hypothetical protein
MSHTLTDAEARAVVHGMGIAARVFDDNAAALRNNLTSQEGRGYETLAAEFDGYAKRARALIQKIETTPSIALPGTTSISLTPANLVLIDAGLIALAITLNDSFDPNDRQTLADVRVLEAWLAEARQI